MLKLQKNTLEYINGKITKSFYKKNTYKAHTKLPQEYIIAKDISLEI